MIFWDFRGEQGFFIIDRIFEFILPVSSKYVVLDPPKGLINCKNSPYFVKMVKLLRIAKYAMGHQGENSFYFFFRRDFIEKKGGGSRYGRLSSGWVPISI
jgi:hypothetical protein